MWKHMALSTVVITLVVVSLLYCISPGELELARAVLSRRASSQASELWAIGSENLGKVVHEVRRTGPAVFPEGQATSDRPRNPDPFRPYDRADAQSNWRLLPGWLRGPPPIAAWVMVTGLLCAGIYIWKRRRRFASEGKRAYVLARAVRRMSEPKAGVEAKLDKKDSGRKQKTESDHDVFHAAGNFRNCVHDAALQAAGSGTGAPKPL